MKVTIHRLQEAYDALDALAVEASVAGDEDTERAAYSQREFVGNVTDAMERHGLTEVTVTRGLHEALEAAGLLDDESEIEPEQEACRCDVGEGQAHAPTRSCY